MAKFTFSKPKRDEFLALLRQGMRRGAAADIVFGSDDPVARKRVRDYIRDNPEFEEFVLDAEVDATEHVEESLYQAAISGNVSAAKAWIDLTRGPRKEIPKPASNQSGQSEPESEASEPTPGDWDALDGVVTPIRRPSA